MSRQQSIEEIETNFGDENMENTENTEIVRAPIAEEEETESLSPRQQIKSDATDLEVVDVDAPGSGEERTSDCSDSYLLKGKGVQSNGKNNPNGIIDNGGDHDQGGDEKAEAENMTSSTHEAVNELYNFFHREKEAFKEEKQKKLRQIDRQDTRVNFKQLITEWKNEEKDKIKEPERHWTYQSVRREGERFPALMTTILTGIFFTLGPNCAIVLDYITASEYIGGNYYLKYQSDLVDTTNCRLVNNQTDPVQWECEEFDPVYGALTLAFTFSSGITWSAILFYQLWTHLTTEEKDKEFWDRKRCLFFFFIPLVLLCIVSFPLQLFLISVIACFNDTNQWVLLTTKIGIAEGLYNAHFQFLLQLFVFFTRADRHPSTFQYLTAFGSLAFLSYSRVESLLLDRGGHRMSPGQKAWWIIRYAPSFLLNCAFKLGSVALIAAMLRFNCLWLYSTVIIVWLLLQILFNEGVLHRRQYYLFLGSGMHGVSVAHIPEDIKIVDTDPNIKKNVMWTTRLTSKQIIWNLRFQNAWWFIFNYVIIITIWVFKHYAPEDTQIPVFWPFTPGNTYTLQDNKVFRVLDIVAPIILFLGLATQIIIWFHEDRPVKVKLPRILSTSNTKDLGTQMSRETDASDVVDAMNHGIQHYDGWQHVPNDDCPGCKTMGRWHKHIYNDEEGGRVQGRFNQIIFPLLNIWDNFRDKNT